MAKAVLYLLELLHVTNDSILPPFTCEDAPSTAARQKTEHQAIGCWGWGLGLGGIQETVQLFRILSCLERIHRPYPWPQLLWKARMNQINIEEALRCGCLSVEPTDSAGREERVINKVPPHPSYFLQSLMISSVFP